MKTERFEVRLSEDDRVLLERLAQKEKVTMTEIVVRALRAYAPRARVAPVVPDFLQ